MYDNKSQFYMYIDIISCQLMPMQIIYHVHILIACNYVLSFDEML